MILLRWYIKFTKLICGYCIVWLSAIKVTQVSSSHITILCKQGLSYTFIYRRILVNRPI